MKLCPCGKSLNYSHIKDGKEVLSCTKHTLCPTYEEQNEIIRRLYEQSRTYDCALEKVLLYVTKEKNGI